MSSVQYAVVAIVLPNHVDMNLNPWRSEWITLLSIFMLTPFIYYLSGWWWLAIATSSGLYIALLWHKLHHIHEWLKSGMPDGKAPEVDGVLGHFVTLIFRHKKASERATREQKYLNQQFNETISAIPSATIILDKENRIEWANYSALTLLGINGQRDMGMKIDNLVRQGDFLKQLQKPTSEQFEIQSPISPNLTLAAQLVKYGERRRLLLAHNITPHIEVQRSRKTFIANASHELRTPLTVVTGYLEFMQSDSELAESLKRPVEKAIEQASNMEMLINDLLILSKLEDKELNAQDLSPIRLKTHLDSTMQTLEASGKTSNHIIRTNIDYDDLIIEANEKELNSICFNLINNAIKYSEANSEIIVSWKKLSENHVKFSVSDQGIGIAPEHIAHLTERFYRVDSGRSKRAGGTGLGLSIVKHILERHHGRLEIHSALGAGSMFSAILPIKQ